MTIRKFLLPFSVLASVVQLRVATCPEWSGYRGPIRLRRRAEASTVPIPGPTRTTTGNRIPGLGHCLSGPLGNKIFLINADPANGIDSAFLNAQAGKRRLAEEYPGSVFKIHQLAGLPPARRQDKKHVYVPVATPNNTR